MLFEKKGTVVGKRKTLALAVSAAAFTLGGHAGAINAQEAREDGYDAIEEVTVTASIRASLKRAMDIKRDAAAVVDAIAAEDIGKFPDQNVAESLQRISGVSISRSGGEGQFVSVRGFGPEFNTTLLNGRTLATENNGRSFSFDTLASEMIAGAEVYKSPLASMPEGGIGATINLKTARPLDIGEFRAAGSFKTQYDDLSEDNRPQVSGLISDTFDIEAGTLGLLGSIAYQKREAVTESIEIAGWVPGSTVKLADGSTREGVYTPRDVNISVDQTTRERFGGNFVAQFSPNDNLTLTLDALYSKFEVESLETTNANWIIPDNVAEATIGANNTVTDMVMVEAQPGGHSTSLVSFTDNRPTVTQMFGFNAEWNASDSLALAFDASWSNAELNNGGNNAWVALDNWASPTISIEGDFVSLTDASYITDPDFPRSHGALFQGNEIEDDIKEVQFDGEWVIEKDLLKRMQFGLYGSDRRKTNQWIRSPNEMISAYWGLRAVPIPEALLSLYSNSDLLSGIDHNVPTAWLSADPAAIIAYFETEAAANQNVPNVAATLAAIENGGFSPIEYPDSYEVRERVLGGYLLGYFDGVVGGVPWSANLGFRYVETDLTSEGAQTIYLSIEENPVSPDVFDIVTSDTPQRIKESGSYGNLLPSLNVSFDLREDVIARLGYSETLSRPTLSQLAPAVSYDLRPDSLQGSGSNPQLEPTLSTNYDLSLEWYPNETGYLALAAYQKELEDFITNTIEDEQLLDRTVRVARPRNGEEATVDGWELAGQYTFDGLPGIWSGLGIQANMTSVRSDTKLLSGLGDSYNVIGFYEKGPIQFRVAYNYRERFLLQQISDQGEPRYVDDYGQWDLSGSFEINDNFTLFFEAINVTNEIMYNWGRFDNHLLSVTDTGARYAVGVRGSF